MHQENIQPGSYIVYGTSGVCLVEGIESPAFSGREQRRYFALRPHRDPASVIYLPCDNDSLLSRVRPLLSAADAEALLAAPPEALAWPEDRKERTLSFRKVLDTGCPSALLALIRCLVKRRDTLAEKNKKLSAAERELLTAATAALGHELSFVLALPMEEIEKRLTDRRE